MWSWVYSPSDRLRSHQLTSTLSQMEEEEGHKKLIVAIFAVNLAAAVFATQIFASGFPVGMDSFSHLPKVLFLGKYGIASWHFDWYAGYPLFIFYPPLSYLLAYFPTLGGADPLVSYKVVEIFFLMLTPYAFYKLCRKMELTPKRALYATLFLSIIPFTFQNSIAFGRFPTIVAYPFFLATIFYIIDTLETRSWRSVGAAAGFFSLTLLTNHLSAYILTLIIIIYCIARIFESSGIRWKMKEVLHLWGAVALGLAFSSIWLIPFIVYTYCWGYGGIDPLSITALSFSIPLFLLLTVGLYWLGRLLTPNSNYHSRVIFTWMTLFLLLGSTLLPTQYLLPFSAELDLLRFQLYASAAVAIFLVTLGNYLLTQSNFGFNLRRSLRKIRVWLMVLIALNVLTAGVTVHYFGTTVADEIYIENPIPHPMIEYLASADGYGRIMAVDCPYSVYLLPHETGKPLIGGWYPQGCIIDSIGQVKKTINSSGNETIFRYLANNAENYGISWVLLGNSSRLHLFEESTFKPVITDSRFTLLENTVNVTYIDAEPHVEAVRWSQQNDMITISLETNIETTNITVKEAYFPGWYAFDNNNSIPISEGKCGFITFQIKEAREHNIVLVFNSYEKLSEAVAFPTRTLNKG